MFNPSVNDVRNFFFDTFAKANQQQALSDLEKMAYSVIMEHPEYQVVLRDREKYLNYNWLPDAIATIPPPTPLLAGKPTEYNQLPEVSYIPAVAISANKLGTNSACNNCFALNGDLP